MRETAREVGSELEATRSELARGVAELPEETRASAAAMRRVVAEQIEALSELNAIVRSQPATHDLHDRRPPQRVAPRPEAPRAEPSYPQARVEREVAPEPVRQVRAEPVRPIQAEPQRQPSPEPVRQTLVDPIRPPEPARTVVERREPPAPTQAPAPAPSTQPTPEADTVANQQDTGGWLRDVLRNASAKQASTQQPPQQQGLSGLTEDIARAIDDAALGDAWGRYQSGEANVFSRRIYTLTGQGTYDDVRKRLQRDVDFARTAQAYMGEFEQLLKRAAAGPRAASETREYLLSDRGKVYTMLAHASGRLN